MRGSISGNSTQDNHRNAQLIRVSQHTHLIMKEFACDSTGRLMEQSGNGMASRMSGMGRNAAGVMADNPALIPLVGNNSRFNIHFQWKCLYLYKVHGGWVSPSA